MCQVKLIMSLLRGNNINTCAWVISPSTCIGISIFAHREDEARYSSWCVASSPPPVHRGTPLQLKCQESTFVAILCRTMVSIGTKRFITSYHSWTFKSLTWIECIFWEPVKVYYKAENTKANVITVWHYERNNAQSVMHNFVRGYFDD